MQARQLSSLGRATLTSLDFAGEQLSGVAPKLANVLRNTAKSGNADAVGSVLQYIIPSFPELGTILSRIDPSFISDFSPLVQATYQANGGEFDETIFNRMHSQFQKTYASGAFGNVPAQVAMHATAFASQQGVPEGQLSSASTNLAQAADSIVNAGLAPDFGAALQLAHSLGGREVVLDPNRVQQRVAQLDNLARRNGISRDQMVAAGQLAAKEGLDPGSVMESVAMGARVSQSLGAQGAAAATDALASFQQQHRPRVLEAARRTNAQFRAQIDRALAAGNEQALDAVYRAARSNPAVVEMAQDPSLGAAFVGHAGQKGMGVNQLIRGEMRDAVRGNAEAQKLMANPQELTRRARTNDWTGLTPETQRLFTSKGNTFAATALAVNPSQAERGRRPGMVAKPEPVTRLGLPYPKKTEQPGRERDLGGRPPALRSPTPTTP